MVQLSTALSECLAAGLLSLRTVTQILSTQRLEVFSHLPFHGLLPHLFIDTMAKTERATSIETVIKMIQAQLSSTDRQKLVSFSQSLPYHQLLTCQPACIIVLPSAHERNGTCPILMHSTITGNCILCKCLSADYPTAYPRQIASDGYTQSYWPARIMTCSWLPYTIRLTQRGLTKTVLRSAG